MKKLICVICIILSTCVTANAAAADDIPLIWSCLSSTAEGSVYTSAEHADIYSAEQLIAAVRNAADNLCNEIAVTIHNFDETTYNIDILYNYDYILNGRGTVTGSTAVINYSITYSSNFKLRRAYSDNSLFAKLNTEEMYAYRQIEKITQDITKGLSTDYEKELAIHDYIIGTYRYYDTDNVENIPIRGHKAAALVIDGEGVCEAYSELFYLMGKMAGLDVGFATGTLNGVSHMWNTIRLDGEYYHVDCTGDDPCPDEEGRHRYNYFNITTDRLLEDHTFDNTDNISCTAEKYNYYTYNNFIVKNYDELKKLISSRFDSGDMTITFRTEGYIIDSAEVIKNALRDKTVELFGISGEYGKDGVFTIILS